MMQFQYILQDWKQESQGAASFQIPHSVSEEIS